MLASICKHTLASCTSKERILLWKFVRGGSYQVMLNKHELFSQIWFPMVANDAAIELTFKPFEQQACVSWGRREYVGMHS